MKAVIITPTFNERENIAEMLQHLVDVCAKIPGYDFSILVVDDNSPDKTQEVVNEFRKKHKNVFLLTGKKEGLGRALLRGMTYATDVLKADIIGQIDADMSHDPNMLPKFFEKFSHGYDFIVGTRYIRGGSIPPNWGLHRKIYSVVGNAIVRYSLGHPHVHDWTGGFRVFNKKYFVESKEILGPYSGYVFQIAFLYNSIKKGAKIGEVPIHFTDRKYGRSKIAPLHYIVSIYSYIFQARIHDVYRAPMFRFAVVGFVGFIINTIVLEAFVKNGFNPVIGSVLGAECAIISNFFFNNGWTFGSRKINGLRLIPKFLQFNSTSIVALLLQASTVWIGTKIAGRSVYFYAYLLGIGFGMVWNYTMYSKVIWKPHK